MVRSAKRVSNHEATDGAFILRDAASRLLRMRSLEWRMRRLK
jgi:hypothetical protein